MSDADAAADAGRAPRLDRFRAGLERHAVTVTETSPGRFEADLADALAPPVVGVALPFPGLTLPETAARPTPAALDEAVTGVTAARLGIADYGSVVLRGGDGTEPASLFVERHVVVLRADDVVDGMADALAALGPRIRAERSSHVLATGPSATADMGDLVVGAHGPAEVHLLLVRGAEPPADRTEPAPERDEAGAAGVRP
jgi:L-lactate dehydrogenase complex protein LldG